MDTNSIVGVVLIVSTAITVVGLVGLFKWLRGMRDPASTGVQVQGTGQVASVQRTRISKGSGEIGSRDDDVEVQCQIALRVQLPGRSPYDATIHQFVDHEMLPGLTSAVRPGVPYLQPGATVVVAADSANPRDVRIDFTQPIRQGGPARPAEPV
jgi:hypothetical protein